MVRIKTRHGNLSLPISHTFGYTFLFNSFIAIFLFAIGFSDVNFQDLFLFSQCIGLSICTCVLLTERLPTPSHPTAHMMVYFGAVLIGSLFGILAGCLFTGIRLFSFFGEPAIAGPTLFVGMVFGSVITYFFFARERLAETSSQLQEERIERIRGQKAALETDLKRLQAQVEPHFLFNTLSNTLSLMDSDPASAKAMLEHLTGYLRTSLHRTRLETSTVGQEMAMTRDYLEVHKIRMGNRFTYRIEASPDTASLPLAPMLIQPLVENALRHGLEPKIDHGKITIRVSEGDRTIRIVVSDTGVGMSAKAASGVGIANVRERLAALYGDNGSLTFEENQPSGLNAIVEVPHAAG